MYFFISIIFHSPFPLFIVWNTCV